jgi:hypothetical protein
MAIVDKIRGRPTSARHLQSWFEFRCYAIRTPESSLPPEPAALWRLVDFGCITDVLLAGDHPWEPSSRRQSLRVSSTLSVV